MGYVYENMGNKDKAAECYDKALKFSRQAVDIDSNKAEAWRELADSYFSLGTVHGNEFETYDEVKEYLKKALEILPYNTKIWFSLADFYYDMENYDKAI